MSAMIYTCIYHDGLEFYRLDLSLGSRLTPAFRPNQGHLAAWTTDTAEIF